jgi:hypothetical protein
MKIADGGHLMYCLNIHPGERLDENISAIRRYATAVRRRVCPDAPFALGLRLSAAAAQELTGRIEEFRRLLAENGFYAVSINGFPYGRFHHGRVKQAVYLPDWTSRDRVAYTCDLVDILSGILPEGDIGTVSTVPGCYGKRVPGAVFDNLLLMARYLSCLERETGRRIVLCLEPEPDCCMDDLASTRLFFDRLFDRAPNLARYIGVCLDCCHAAVAFESPFKWYCELTASGVAVPKIQVSAAVRMNTIVNDRERILSPFLDNVYLHQTRIRNMERTYRFTDLDQALCSGVGGEWRIHFHVPLTWRHDVLSSTAGLIEPELLLHAVGDYCHLEVETYSLACIPGETVPLEESIASELEWVMRYFK